MAICENCGKNTIDIYIGTEGENFIWLPWCKCGHAGDKIKKTKTMVEIWGGFRTSPVKMWELANMEQ